LPEPLVTKPIGTPFIELQSVDSTNNYAREQIQVSRSSDLPVSQAIAAHGMVFFTHEQSAGKGQRGKIWTSEAGVNIMLSVLVKPQGIPLAQQFRLSACVAVAVQDLFMKYAGEDTTIKWPNDLYWQDRKAGGILIENIVRSGEPGARSQEPGTINVIAGEAKQWEWSIVGIGININQAHFPADLPNPVSLKQITGKDFDTVALAKELCATLDKKFNELTRDGFEKIYQEYLLHLYKRKEKVKLKKDNRVFEATIKTITPSGKLVVQHSIEEEFDFGEIEWNI
jgi:BirA family biotin operon repressor/biotin-[acetyl-CoA-carboxylase] ligase